MKSVKLLKFTAILIFSYFLMINIVHSFSVNDGIDAAKKKEVEIVARELIENIISKNVAGILNAIEEPFQCGDGLYSYDKIQQDLLDTKSDLYVRLFNTNEYKKKHAGYISLREYFIKNKNLKITVNIPENAGHLADIYFKQYIQFYFLYNGARWVLIEGLYDCP